MKQVVQYARVSLEMQDGDDKASIQQQLATMDELCVRKKWHVTEVFQDKRNYTATLPPNKGKTVNPSGERADRPRFLAMLERIETGDVDIVLCWRDDRLVRHPRVAVALEDALDIGDGRRNGKPKIEIRDATGAPLDRFTLSIKATLWREENKRRAERSRMGKMATLQQGGWPGGFRRWGYKTVKETGKRGRIIVEDPETSPVVRKIFEMYDAGTGVTEIRKHLISLGTPQIHVRKVKHEWSKVLIYKILRSKACLGEATWTFKDGIVLTVEIPQILDPELWQRVQSRLDRNKTLSTRNAKGVYLLQGLSKCGECGNGLSIFRDITYKGKFGYRCHTANHHPHEPHARPYSHNGTSLDWAVWRHIVDDGINRPDLIREQVQLRQAELQAQGDDVDSEIARAHHRLAKIDEERAFYQRQGARSKLTEAEFDVRMDETEESRTQCETEIARLEELRDNAAKVQAGLDYATDLMTKLRGQLEEIDITPSELDALPEEERNEVLRARQEIIRVLCDKVTVYADRRVVIEGMLDGTEAAQFRLLGS